MTYGIYTEEEEKKMKQIIEQYEQDRKNLMEGTLENNMIDSDIDEAVRIFDNRFDEQITQLIEEIGDRYFGRLNGEDAIIDDAIVWAGAYFSDMRSRLDIVGKKVSEADVKVFLFVLKQDLLKRHFKALEGNNEKKEEMEQKICAMMRDL